MAKSKGPNSNVKAAAEKAGKGIEALIGSKEMQNEKTWMAKNGMADVLGFSDSLLGFNPGGIGTQLSQVDTLFKNQRWYLVSNMRQLLCEMYVELGIVQTIVDVPVEDGFRGGVTIKSKQLDEDQIEQLNVSLDRDDDLNTIAQAVKWNRLFGGAGVMIMTDQDPETEFDINAIKPDSPLEFRAVDMWELFWDKQNVEGYDPEIQEHGFEYYNYYAKKVHKSRVMRMRGLTAPSFIRPRLRGWGFSIVEALVRSINQYLKATDLSFEVLDEFKVDVFRMKNLTSTLLSPGGEAQVRKRVQLTNATKNYQNAIVMDMEDEWDHKQLSFAGLAETMKGIREQLASDMRMPLTKLFGVSAAGFSSGEDDIENYNAMVESQVRSKCKYDILRVIEIKCQKLFGMVPDDIRIEFKPLRILSAEQEENVKTQKFTRILQAKQAGEITRFEFREVCNKENLFGITLDTSGDTLNPDDPDVAELVAGEPKEETDVDDPGANRADEKKPRLSNQEGEAQIVTVGLVCGGEILTGQRRDNKLWNNPGGHVDAGEDFESAAVREVFEETGITITKTQLKKLPSERIKSKRADKFFTIHPFIAEIPKQMPKTTNDPDSEFEIFRWVKIDPSTPELKPEARHANTGDHVVQYLLRKAK